MTTHDAMPISGIKNFTTAQNGELAVFTLVGPGGEEATFCIGYQMLPGLIASLCNASQAAAELRAKNPIHQGGERSGYILNLDSVEMGPIQDKPGQHALQLGVVSTKGGKSVYLVGANKANLIALRNGIDEYLCNPPAPIRLN